MRFNPLKILLLTAFLAVSFQLQPAAAQPSPENSQDPILSQAFLDDRHLFTDAGTAAAVSAQGDAASDVQFGVVRKRNVEIDGALLAGGPRVGAQAATDGSPADDRKIVLNLFDDVNLIAVVHKVDFTDKGVNWVGKIEGDPTSSVIFVTQDGVCSGNVRYLGKYYEIRYNASQVHTVAEVDEGQLPDEAPPISQDEDPLSGDGSGAVGEVTGSAAPLGEGDVALPDGAGEIDVMVLYTPAARAAMGGTAGIESLVNLAMLETNQAYVNSNIATTLNLVHTEEAVGYVEAVNFADDLYRLSDNTDGYLDEAHTLRDVYGADLVSLITAGSSSYCGIAWILQNVDPLSEYLGFSVTRYNCATGNYTFGHELGHNQGCRHDPANAGSAGAYPYSYGYWEPTSYNFRTIMAYNCPGGCPRIQHFSNPSVDYFGQPTGAALADNALTIDNTAIAVANYRESTQAGQIPAMQSPTPGSTISNPNETFTWTTTGIVTNHQLWIGTAPASNNLYDSLGLGVATSVQASGIPQNGSTVYVRLWYEIDQVWGFIDYVYDTFEILPEPPVLNSPAPGSTLSASPTTFSWSAGVGATQYWFTLGSAPGLRDIADLGSGLSQSISVPVVLDGNDVWAEVWLYTGTVWLTNGPVQFSTIDVPKGEAQIQSPTPGSTLTSNPVTLTWDTGAGALQYWLVVGTTPGGANLVNVGKGLSLSHTLEVPLNGNPIYVELWTQLATGWESTGQLQYNTINQVAQITSPTPGSTISSTPVNFVWTSTPGAIQYWFTLGTIPGGANLASQGTGTATSLSVPLSLTGSNVYAEVWVNVGGTWLTSGPQQYGTMNNPNGPGVIQSPAAGSQVNASPVTFTWTPGTAVTQHWLTVGTTSGGTNIYTASAGLNTQATVNVPLNGGTIFAEVWSNVAGTWMSDGPVQYTTVNNLPSIQTPTPGSTLTSSPVTFTWNAGTGIVQYWLTVGTTSGGQNIYTADPGLVTQKSVNIPLTGNPVYVELWSYDGISWKSQGPLVYQTQ